MPKQTKNKTRHSWEIVNDKTFLKESKCTKCGLVKLKSGNSSQTHYEDGKGNQIGTLAPECIN
jgi:hypothetical protein